MDRPAFFAFYPADFANDINVESMSTLQVGAYILLLCKAWQAEPPASLPSEDAVLARLARVELAVWLEIKLGVLAAFRPGTDGRLHNKRLRLEYDKANKLIRESKKHGQRGAQARWSKHRGSIAPPLGGALPEQCASNAIQSQNQIQKEDIQTPAESGAGRAVKPREPAKPRQPRERDPLFDAIVEVTGSDPKLNGSHIGKLRKSLLQAEPPYSPEEVLRLADTAFQNREMSWLNGRRPTIGEIEKFISRVRNPSSAGRSPPGRFVDRADAEAQQMAEYAEDAFGGGN
jgi:uncharacterized protein YdaU (DUF1376 family)